MGDGARYRAVTPRRKPPPPGSAARYEYWSHRSTSDTWIVEVVDDRPAGCYGPIPSPGDVGHIAHLFPYLDDLHFQQLLAASSDYVRRPMCPRCHRAVEPAGGPCAQPGCTRHGPMAPPRPRD